MIKIKEVLTKLVGADNVEKILESNKPKELEFDVSLEQLVHAYLRKAFWENFKQEISKTPPNYKQIGNIVNDIKGYMKKIYENRENEKQYLDEILDSEFIEMRVKNGTYTNTMFLDLIRQLYIELKKLDSPEFDSSINNMLFKLENIKTQQEFIDTIVDGLKYLLDRLETLTKIVTEVRKKNLVK